MTELFLKEGRSIFTFKRGDIIIRVQPVILTETKFNENLGVSVKVQTGIDHSFRSPVEFMGIENNLIYLRDLRFDKFYSKKIVHTARLELYADGWELFTLPEGVTLEDFAF